MTDVIQSKRESFIEANVNTWIGLAGSFALTAACNLWILPGYGVWWATTASVALCTVWSLLRGYYVRRFFNRRHKRKLNDLLKCKHDDHSSR